MDSAIVRLLAASAGAVLLCWAHRRSEPAQLMADAAGRFLAALTPEQQTRAAFRLEDEERLNWHYIPRERKGVPLRDMTSTQRHLAHALLAAGLSQPGCLKANTIMSLEEVLKLLENDSGERRDPDKYYFSIFGQPSENETWGYRIEGHHLSLNFTLSGGKVTGSPSFFGANPASIRHGARKGLRTLAGEEDLARELLGALNTEQKATATVDKKAYPDILTTNSRRAALQGQPSGLAAARMTSRQRDLLHTLLAEYANNLSAQLAEARLEQVRQAGGNLHFAWAGPEARGAPHYYRIQGPTFLVEYDNTQDNANHIHSVWRDLEGDFGLDVLKIHYRSGHR